MRFVSHAIYHQCTNPLIIMRLHDQGASPYSIMGERRTDSCTCLGLFFGKHGVLQAVGGHGERCTWW